MKIMIKSEQDKDIITGMKKERGWQMRDDRDDEQRDDRGSVEDRREQRRQRRVRNQIIVYVTVAILLTVICCGLFLGAVRVRGILEQYQANEVAEQASQDASEAITIGDPDAASTAATQSRDDMLNEIVETCISEMPVEDKVAGLFLITPEQLTGVDSVVKAGSGTQDAISKYAVGGIVYNSKNMKDQDQITSMLSDTQNMSKYPLFFATDEEGGDKSTVAGMAGKDKAPAAADIGDSETAVQSGNAIGTYLAACGFNLDFAPVSDIADENAKEKSIFYGTDAAKVGPIAAGVVQGLQETGVSACMKFFPVMGNSSDEAQNGIEKTDRTLDDMRQSEFLPFQSGIQAGVNMIMVSNIAAPSVTGDNTPCSLSSVMITDELRNELGYTGIVVTDALNQSAITDYYTPDQAAVAAIQAGADLLYIPEDFQKAYDGLLKAVQSGTVSESRIDESLKRIYRIKYADKVDGIAADDAMSAATDETAASESSSGASEQDSASAGAENSAEESN